MKKKAQLDTSFAWIFAIIVGAVVLSLAIYGVYKFSNMQRTQQSAESSKQVDVYLDALESGYETGQKINLVAPVETRILSYCTLDQEFGRQKIQILEKTYDRWTQTGVNITSRNKYIFSENPIEGKKFIAFSKPYEFPSENSYEFSFKIADLIYLISSEDNYCFIDAPYEIEREIENLNADNLMTENCSEESLKICFDGNEDDCYAEVERNNNGNGIVTKYSKEMPFDSDALMYAAIFSYKELYECQLSRVIKRAEQLTLIYEEKARIEMTQGCTADMGANLAGFRSILHEYDYSNELYIISNEAKRINKQNSLSGECKLW